MDIDDKELFESATTDEAIVETVSEQVAPEPVVDDGQPRDEHGRFASKSDLEQPALPTFTHSDVTKGEITGTVVQPGKEEANVPSWRLREEREAREAAERRVQEAEARWQRQFQELQAKLPKPEPAPVPDVFENPNAFVDHNVRQAVDPLKSEMQQMREEFSRMRAEDKHGADKVKAAFDWIKQGLANGEPEAIATHQRAMRSAHPYGELVTAHEQRTVYQTIGNDPKAWFQTELQKLISDPAQAGALLQQIQQSARPAPQQQNNLVKLPPSLSKVPAAHVAEDDNDTSDAGLFRHATR